MLRSSMSRLASFIDTTTDATSMKELNSLLLFQASPYGVERFACAQVGRVDTPSALGRIVGTEKSDWIDRYRREGLIARDHSVRRAIVNPTPFTWQESAAEVANDYRSFYIFEAARDHGIVSGLFVPIHCGDGALDVVSFTGSKVDDDPESKSSLHLLAIYYQAATARLSRVELANDNPIITNRQIECLHWVAAGKTDWEIGAILGLSEATINRHVERAKERLGVKTRVQAVVEALSLGLLQI
jgi:DNA-binding CsgD family transcriptional regulator